MLELSLVGALLISLTVVIHAFGTTYWVRFLVSRYVQEDGQWYSRKSMRILIGTGLVLVGLHVIQIIMWAVTYRALVPPAELATLETAIYFSFVTFTTLGYGDITLSEGWRLLSGIEAMNGILLVGWSTAVLFAVVQRMWQGTAGKDTGKN
jgi:voltage-gated potassium channel Kch